MRKAVQIQNAIANLFPELALEADQLEAIDRFLAGLLHWNKKVNLTAIRDFDGLVTKHLLDSLAPLGLCARGGLECRITGKGVDLGSGAGLPGIIIALMLPQVEVTSLEKVKKKVAFQTWAKAEIGIKNFKAQARRFDEVAGGDQDFVLARALAEMDLLLGWADHFLRPGGLAWLWKGQGFETEWEGVKPELKEQFTLVESASYQLDQSRGGRIVVFKKASD